MSALFSLFHWVQNYLLESILNLSQRTTIVVMSSKKQSANLLRDNINGAVYREMENNTKY